MPRPIHFDLSADNPQRAAEFYRKVFNWKVEKWQGADDYWLIQTGTEKTPGITGGLAGRILPGDTTAVVFDVESVDDAARKVVACGGEIREPKRLLQGIGYLVMCKDTEGNTFGLLQLEATSK